MLSTYNSYESIIFLMLLWTYAIKMELIGQTNVSGKTILHDQFQINNEHGNFASAKIRNQILAFHNRIENA